MESYLYDPLNLWAGLHKIGRAPDPGFLLQSMEVSRLRFLERTSLQAIINVIDQMMDTQFPAERTDAQIPVLYQDGLILMYP